jgi:hypothetical protein
MEPLNQYDIEFLSNLPNDGSFVPVDSSTAEIRSAATRSIQFGRAVVDRSVGKFAITPAGFEALRLQRSRADASVYKTDILVGLTVMDRRLVAPFAGVHRRAGRNLALVEAACFPLVRIMTTGLKYMDGERVATKEEVTAHIHAFMIALPDAPLQPFASDDYNRRDPAKQRIAEMLIASITERFTVINDPINRDQRAFQGRPQS